MVTLSKRDDALLLSHLRAVGIDIPVGESVCLRINGLDIDFVPMRPDRSGRPSHGLKAHRPKRASPGVPLSAAIPRGE